MIVRQADGRSIEFTRNNVVTFAVGAGGLAVWSKVINFCRVIVQFIEERKVTSEPWLGYSDDEPGTTGNGSVDIGTESTQNQHG